MSVKRFKFVSPGIFINEVDNSQLPQAPEEMGPVIIGRSLRGPGMRPVKVDSFSEFVELFGEPVAGLTGEDVWRQGHILGPTYAAYAAQAYLKSGGPVTFVRLLGEQHDDHTSAGVQAGWEVESATDAPTLCGPGAYGLFISNGGGEAVGNAVSRWTIAHLVDTTPNSDFTALQTVASNGDGDAEATGSEMFGMVVGTDATANSRLGAVQIEVGEAISRRAVVGLFIVNATATDDIELRWENAAGAAQTFEVTANLHASNGGTVNAKAKWVAATINASAAPFLAFVGDEGVAAAEAEAANGGARTINGDWNSSASVLIYALHPGVVHSNDTMALVTTGANGVRPVANPVSTGTSGGALAATVDFAGGPNGTALSGSATSAEYYYTGPVAKGVGGVGMNNGNTQHGSGTVSPAYATPLLAAEAVRDLIIAAINNDATNNQVSGHATFASYQSAAPVTAATLAQLDVTWLADAGPDSPPTGASPAIAAAVLETINSTNFTAANYALPTSADAALNAQHGVLAAILYSAQGGLHLTGTDMDGTAVSSSGTTAGGQNGVARWIKSTGANNSFAIGIKSVARAGAYNSQDCQENIAFNFDVNSKNYIRNVLNTNPTLTNANITGDKQGKGYWLGQTFDSHLSQSQRSSATVGILPGNRVVDGTTPLTTLGASQFACLVPLEQKLTSGDDAATQNGQLAAATPAQSPWIISQHQGTPADWNTASNAMLLNDSDYRDVGVQRLFKIHSLYAGEWDMKNFKISIYDVKGPSNSYEKYGSFGLGLRKADDTDAAPVWVERYSGLNLNPASPDYIARRIGDMETIWDEGERRYTDRGQYLSQSRYIRIEMADDIDAGAADARLLPFGFVGPTRYNSVLVRQGRMSTPQAPATAVAAGSTDNDATELSDAQAVGQHPGADRELMMFETEAGSKADTGNVPVSINLVGETEANMATDTFQTVLKFPSLRLRSTTQDDTLSSPKDAYFGVDTRMVGSERHDLSYADMVRRMVPQRDGVSLDSEALEYQFIFTLDDVERVTGSATHASWQAGRYAAGASLNAAAGASYTTVLDAGFNSFTLPLIGGQDGMNITEVEPFRSGATAGGMQSSSTQLTHYAYNSVKKAIDTVADPEVVECNMMAMPGIALASLTQHMINVCENRADALAVVDLEGDYVPRSWGTDSEAARMPNVDTAVRTLKERGINSSYACAYFPWVQIRDNIGSRLIWAPPSVVALGTMSSSAKRTDVWFAPAGFTRGGLTEGSAGLPVLQVRHRLSSKERDKLYEASINPIAQFPSEGIVIFGQKTLQVTQSALDRINVRRLMIYLKKNVSRFAKTVLFDQNVQTTWSRFVSKVDPFLASVKSNFGLTEYKIVLDETTTTPELIDRNIMYAKIFLKPARAIEYIAIDFVITDSGASFDD